MFRVFVFFFQAEDGIRDWSVTGVQTCALPISLNRLFLQMPEEEIRAIAKEVNAECLRQGLTYVDEGGAQRVIALLLRPRVINPIQRSYFHYVCLQVVDALKKLAALYLVDPRIRRLLPLGEAEEEWL